MSELTPIPEPAPPMLVDVSSLLIDIDREMNGVQATLRPGVDLWIASAGRVEYQAAARDLVRAWREAHPGEELTDRDTYQAIAPAVAKHLLRGWTGLGVAGKPLAYSEAAALALLSPPGAYWITAFVVARAADVDAYLVGAAKSAEGD